MLKKIMLAAMAVAVPAMLFAQSAINWQTDYDGRAVDESRSTGKPIFIFFTDGGAPSKALEKKLFSDKAFIAFANKNFIMYKAEFIVKPAKKAEAPKPPANKTTETDPNIIDDSPAPEDDATDDEDPVELKNFELKMTHAIRSFPQMRIVNIRDTVLASPVLMSNNTVQDFIASLKKFDKGAKK